MLRVAFVDKALAMFLSLFNFDKNAFLKPNASVLCRWCAM